MVVYVSDPTDPTWAGNCGSAGSAWSVAVSGNYTYVANYDSGLQILQVNYVPSAYIDSISPSPASKSEKVSFNGSGSDSDGTVDGYEWRSNLDGILSNNAIFSTSSLSVGDHTITFRVQDDDGTWSEGVIAYLVVIAIANQPPDATIISIAPNPATFGATVTFNGSGNDEDGEIIASEWEIDGNIVSIAAAFSLDSLTEGNHTVRFRVQDNEEEWSEWASENLTIHKPPKLGLLAKSDFALGRVSIFVNSDKDLASLTIIVDSEGNLTAVVMQPHESGDLRNFTGAYNFTKSGMFLVNATGLDLEGEEGEASITVFVQSLVSGPDSPAVLDAQDTTGVVLEVVTGNETTGRVSVSVTTHPPPAPSDFQVTDVGIYVTVDIDDTLLAELDYVNITIYYDPLQLPEGLSEEALRIYHYSESTGRWENTSVSGRDPARNLVWGHFSNFSVFAIYGSNIAPVADAGEDQTVGIGQVVTLHGTGIDPDVDGRIALYEWDFDGDGVFDYQSTTSGVVTHSYDGPGTYKARLRITDTQGATGFDMVVITVGESEKDDLIKINWPSQPENWGYIGLALAIIVVIAVAYIRFGK